MALFRNLKFLYKNVSFQLLLLLVSFAGSVTVLVMVQLIAALAVVNLISRTDQPPLWIISPLEGVFGKMLCLSNVPLFGQVIDH